MNNNTKNQAYHTYIESYAPDWKIHSDFSQNLAEVLVLRWSENNPYEGGEHFPWVGSDISWAEELQFFLLFQNDNTLVDKVLNSFEIALAVTTPSMKDGNTWFLDIMALRRCDGDLSYRAWNIIQEAIVRLCEDYPSSDPTTLTAFAECYSEVAHSIIGEVSAPKLATALFRSGTRRFPWGTKSLFRTIAKPVQLSVNRKVFETISQVMKSCDKLFKTISMIYTDSLSQNQQTEWSVEHLGKWQLLFDESALLLVEGVSEAMEQEASAFLTFINYHYEQEPLYSPLKNGWLPRVGQLFSEALTEEDMFGYTESVLQETSTNELIDDVYNDYEEVREIFEAA